MATFNVIIRDVRLHGWKPQGDEVLEVNFDTPISWPLRWASNLTLKDKPILKLMSHGYPGGMRFCREDITRDTMHLFEKLRSKFHRIELHACGTAKMAQGHGKPGDGNFLCYRLAQITQSYLRASRHTQLYGMGTGPKNGVDFGKWQGTVVTWAPSGAIVKIRHYPLD